LGFIKSEADPNLYYIVVGGEPLILVLYVDDLILTGTKKLVQERSCRQVLDEGYGAYALFPWARGLAG